MDHEVTYQHSYYLEPGYIFCTQEPATVHTVLGTCVAVCLWDKQRGFGGMNHFILPHIQKREKATAKFGNVATLELVNMMLKAGSKKHNLIAQILGGAAPRGLNKYPVGEENVSAARHVLKKKGIYVGSEDIGGNMGRKIVFDTHTGHVMVLKVHKIREDDWITEGGCE